jgi:DNA-directed RNA polymerase sigma subunit (sigma70/sigma32)
MKGRPTGGGEGLTHLEIGQRLGLSRARVAQIEKSALQKLRRALEKKPMRPPKAKHQ